MSWLAQPGILFAADQLFDITPVVDGVYAVLAKPTFRTNGNAAIVLLDDGVLVVDTESCPSAAREVIAGIKRLTDKPVKYVVITHAHGDHSQGAEAYVSAFPGVQIIASEATRQGILERSVTRMQREFITVPQQIAQLQADLQKMSDAKQREQTQESIRRGQAYLAEIKQIQFALPTVIVDRSLILEGKTRRVEILWMGRSHTAGDLYVYLPKEKVVITGDALQSLTPTMRDSYPFDWIRTLDAVQKLDFDYVIGGHGDVLRGKAAFELWKQYFTDLLAEAGPAYAAGGTLDDFRKRMIPVLLTKYAGKFPARFPQTVIVDVEKVYRVIGGATN
jgi:glyoxylase-like metal-dependent hydrolase (beta-lactamase superfamily II)